MFPLLYEHLLSVLILSPLLGIVVLLLIPRRYEEASSEIALVSSGLTFFIAILVFLGVPAEGKAVFNEVHEWIPSIGVSYHVAANGFNSLLLLIVTFLILFSVIVNWRQVGSGKKEAFASLLVFEIGLIGFFVSVDVLVMYLFMEIAVIAFGFTIMFFAKGTTHFIEKYVGYMGASGLVLFVVIVFLMVSYGSSDLMEIQKRSLSGSIGNVVLALLMISAFCRTGIFPFHGWLKDLRGFGASFLLMGLMCVVGPYLLYRLLPAFATPLANLSTILTWIIVLSIFASAMISLAEVNMEEFVGFVINVHFGFILLGFVSLNEQGLSGSAMEMVSLMLSIATISALFTFIKRRGVDVEKNLFRNRPLFGLFYFIVLASLAGIPGLSHFPGLFLVWMGLFKSSWIIALVSILGIVLVAIAVMRFLGMVLYVEKNSEEKRVQMKASEWMTILPLAIAILVLGIFPDIVLERIKESMEAIWTLF